MSNMEKLLRDNLNTKELRPYGRSGGGCINQGTGFMTDDGAIFVKFNRGNYAKQMFDGEYESLKAMYRSGCIRVPKPIKVIEDASAGGAMLATEYIDFSGGRSHSAEFGKQLARMHLHNSELLKRETERAQWVTRPLYGGGDGDATALGGPLEPVTKFGFHIDTCCGRIRQVNDWTDDWVQFFMTHRIKLQMDMLIAEGAKELPSLWTQLERKVGDLFSCIDGPILPALLHGDLWSGNYSETENETVIFDPASFYGHSEYEFGIMQMFGGFDSRFHDAYFSVIPKAPGFEKRTRLYELFHNLNHWNHFGSGYKSSSLSLINKILKS